MCVRLIIVLLCGCCDRAYRGAFTCRTVRQFCDPVKMSCCLAEICKKHQKQRKQEETSGHAMSKGPLHPTLIVRLVCSEAVVTLLCCGYRHCSLAIWWGTSTLTDGKSIQVNKIIPLLPSMNSESLLRLLSEQETKISNSIYS